MTEVLPRKVRWLAARLHLAGLVWIPLCLATYTPVFSITDQIWSSISGTRPSQGAPSVREWAISLVSFLFTIPTVSIGLAIILLLLVWRIDRKVHPSIGQAGRSTINMLLSINLYYLILFLVSAMFPLLHFFGLSSLLAVIPPFVHSGFALTGFKSVLDGKVYSSPTPIKFVK